MLVREGGGVKLVLVRRGEGRKIRIYFVKAQCFSKKFIFDVL